MRYIVIISILLITSLVYADTVWYECPYKRRVSPERYCGMNDYTPMIYKDGGEWTETEIGNNKCIVKVSASKEVLEKITGCEKLKDKTDAESRWTPRTKPYYDELTDTIKFSDKIQPTKSIDTIDKKVIDGTYTYR